MERQGLKLVSRGGFGVKARPGVGEAYGGFGGKMRLKDDQMERYSCPSLPRD